MTCGGSKSLVAMRRGISKAQGRVSPPRSCAADELLGSSASACESQAVPDDAHACPCCGHRTLAERAGFEICSVCFWEDDGQDDVDAHVDRGGPNRGTLWLARANFLKFGACEEVAKQHVRPPTQDEPQTRQWSLLGDVAVELRPIHPESPSGAWGGDRAAPEPAG